MEAFASYDSSLAGVYAEYNTCRELTGKEFASCALSLYEPWNTALRAFIEPVDQARASAAGTCAANLEKLDLPLLDKRQQDAVSGLQKHQSGPSPKVNERFLELALAQHEALVRSVLTCVSPADTEPAVPSGGFALDLYGAALDT